MNPSQKIHFENMTLYFYHDKRVLGQQEYSQLKTDLRKALPICLKVLKSRDLVSSRRITKVDAIELSLSFCGPRSIQRLNKEFRGKNKITDVLSFPTFEDLRKANAEDLDFPILSLGDIVICSQVAKRQALEHEIDFFSEALHLFCHGFLHLVGYDHELSQKEEELMQKKEDEMVRGLIKAL